MRPDRDNLHRQIASLLRQKPVERETTPAPDRAVQSNDVVSAASPQLTTVPVPRVEPGLTVAQAFPGDERSGQLGPYFVCRQIAERLVCGADDAARQLGASLITGGGEADLHAELQALRGLSPGAMVFLDLETAGLSSAPAFLVGVLRLAAEGMIVEQFLARDYAEEPAMLYDVGHLLQGALVVVTFNGKTFDVPYLRDRMTYYGLPWAETFQHVDLLHHARRRWKGRFPNCRLQTLEERICLRRRIDDVPGELIPQQYHEFVRTQEAALMAPILHHNLLDLVTLVELLSALLAARDPGDRMSQP